MVARNSGVFTDILPASYVLWGIFCTQKNLSNKTLMLTRSRIQRLPCFAVSVGGKSGNLGSLGLGNPE